MPLISIHLTFNSEELLFFQKEDERFEYAVQTMKATAMTTRITRKAMTFMRISVTGILKTRASHVLKMIKREQMQ